MHLALNLERIINIFLHFSILIFIMGRQRKKRDPLAPKKPIGPFFEFAKDERPKVTAELGPISIGETGKELGRRWKSLSKGQKEEYKEKAKGNAKKYADEMDQFSKKKGVEVAPKKPLSSYLEFAKEERPKVLAELGSLTPAEVGKELGKRWKNIPKDVKDRFEEVRQENQKVYEKEVEEFLQKTPEAIATPVPDGDFELLPESSISATVVDSEASQPISSPPPETTAPKFDPKPPTETKVKAADLGFAKTKGYQWHPALKTSMNARGTRISVTYFGTAQTGIVDKVRWIPFSSQAEAKITTPRLLQNVGFKKGMDQLRNLLTKIESAADKSTLESGVGFSAQPVGRKLVKLSKDGLQKDEEQNMRLMQEKIVEITDDKFKWGCRDCSWRGKYSHKAKCHARDCGSRMKEKSKKPKPKKYECSGAGCTLTFPFLSQLQKHYR